jgi:hypothetical protein
MPVPSALAALLADDVIATSAEGADLHRIEESAGRARVRTFTTLAG